MTVVVRVAPKAKRQRIDGLVAEADGGCALRISVTAPPEGGKANDAVIALLAKTWKVPRRAISVLSGAGARRKVLVIEGDATVLRPRIEAFLEDVGKNE